MCTNLTNFLTYGFKIHENPKDSWQFVYFPRIQCRSPFYLTNFVDRRFQYSRIHKTPKVPTNQWRSRKNSKFKSSKIPENLNFVHILSFDKSMQITIQFDDFFDEKDPKFSNSLTPEKVCLHSCKSIWRAFLQQKSHEIFYLNFVNFSKFKVGLPYKEEIPNTLENCPTRVHFTMTFRNPNSKSLNGKSNSSWNLDIFAEFKQNSIFCNNWRKQRVFACWFLNNWITELLRKSVTFS